MVRVLTEAGAGEHVVEVIGNLADDVGPFQIIEQVRVDGLLA